MEYGILLSEFIQTLAGTDNSLAIIAQAFAAVAEQYGIGELKGTFSAPPGMCNRQGEERADVLYSNGASVDRSTEYCNTYRTGENGIVSFFIYKLQGKPAFTEEEKKELKPFFDALFIHFGRYRMIHSLQRMGITDNLTGLPNTGGFMAYINECVRKNELTQYNAFYFNLERFSLVNKRFGVNETDKIIIRYAKELSRFLVEGECLGRMGGDNFVALIQKARTYEFLELIAGVKTFGIIGNQEFPVIVSAIAGVIEIDESVEHGGMVMDDCRMAYNVAKYSENKAYTFVSQEIKDRLYKEKQYASRFADAFEKKEFKTYYQPKVQTEDYVIVGAEALVRWEHDGKLIPPGDFIPVFERNGMVCKLDFFMLEQVCKDIKRWLEMGMEPVRVSVNFSRMHLTNPRLADEIMEIMRTYETESKYVEIELTETVDEAESERLIAFMNRMKECDVAMSIDDFGSGYSSLNLLRTFPVDVLKIDKTFIDTIGRSDRIVLSNIIRMATELEMDVVAEGVETWEQLEYLKQMNCNVVQGFLFDRPMPREQYEQKMLMKQYDVTEICK